MQTRSESLKQESTETNIARFQFGSTILASSFNERKRHSPENVLLESCKYPDQKWASSPEARHSSHWLVVDFGKERAIHRIRIKHAGILEGANLNTSDFRLQYRAGNEWKDIVPPIVGNEESMTVHEFDPVKAKSIRLYITKPSQKQEKPHHWDARIYALEAYQAGIVPTEATSITRMEIFSPLIFSEKANENQRVMEVGFVNCGRETEGELLVHFPQKCWALPIQIQSGLSRHKVQIPMMNDDTPIKLRLLIGDQVAFSTSGIVRIQQQLATSRFFVIECLKETYKVNEARFRAFLPYADRCFEIAAELLGVRPVTRITVRVEEQNRIRGWTDRRGLLIHMTERCFSSGWRDGLFTIFAHELTHRFMHSCIGRGFPPWLVEPLASYFNMEIVRRAAPVLGDPSLVSDAMNRVDTRDRQVFEWGNSSESQEARRYIWREKYPESYKHRRMGMYIFIVLRNRYGIGIFRRFVEAILDSSIDLSQLETHQKNRMAIECLGKAAGENLFPLFRTFGFRFHEEEIGE